MKLMKQEIKTKILSNVGSIDGEPLIAKLESLGIADDIQFYDKGRNYGISIPVISIKDIQKLKQELSGLSKTGRPFRATVVNGRLEIDMSVMNINAVTMDFSPLFHATTKDNFNFIFNLLPVALPKQASEEDVPEIILDKINNIARSQVKNEGNKLGEGTGSVVYPAVLPIKVTVQKKHPDDKTDEKVTLTSLDHLKVVKANAKNRQKMAREADAILAKNNIRSPFINYYLAITDDQRIAEKALGDLDSVTIENTFDNVRGLVGQLILGLEELHSHHIVHRDIKPGNILVFPEGTVKLHDFESIACVNERGNLPPEVDNFGSPDYRAPEMYNMSAQVKAITDFRKIDIYALGVTLYGRALTACQKDPDNAKAKALSELVRSFQAYDPKNRPLIEDIKKNVCFGETEKERQEFFDCLKRTHTKEIYSGHYLVGPHSHLGDAFNLMPPSDESGETIKDQYHAFGSLANQHKILLAQPQKLVPGSPELIVFYRKLNDFMKEFPEAPKNENDPYSGSKQEMFNWVKKQYSILQNVGVSVDADMERPVSVMESKNISFGDDGLSTSKMQTVLESAVRKKAEAMKGENDTYLTEIWGYLTTEERISAIGKLDNERLLHVLQQQQSYRYELVLAINSLEDVIHQSSGDPKTVAVAEKILKHIKNSNKYKLADKDIPLLAEFAYRVAVGLKSPENANNIDRSFVVGKRLLNCSWELGVALLRIVSSEFQNNESSAQSGLFGSRRLSQALRAKGETPVGVYFMNSIRCRQ